MKMILLVGPPGSGKSTMAKQMVAADPSIVYVNQDSQGKGEHYEIFKQAVRDGKSIIVDRMNFNKEQRRKYLFDAQYGYKTEIHVLHEPRAVCMERALARKDHETIQDEKSARSAIDFFFKSYERVEDSEADLVVRHWPKNEKPNAIICDLDGTLADCEHRRHFVRRTDGQKKDWVGFFKGMSDDKVIAPVAAILKLFSNISPVYGDKAEIVLCSGRPDDYKKLTKEWLEKHGIGYDALFMRQRHDSRQDDIVKEIILDFEILTRYTPYMILDDRDQVVRMWRRRGYQCLQVAEGDF